MRKRARKGAPSPATYTCPHCGLVSSGVTCRGGTRRACPSPHCQGRDWSAAAQRWLQGARRRTPPHLPARRCDLPADTVLCIRDSHIPGLYGYRRLARDHAVSVSTVRRIVQGETYRYLLPRDD